MENGKLREIGEKVEYSYWEKYDEESGTFTYHTQTLEIPGDWEYLPYAARWGEYTPYLDARYTQSYSYPGDNIDYTIFLTAAKG